jgi:hypothetical protein
MKPILLISILICSVRFVSAQEINISGKITDTEGNPVTFASVSLCNLKDSTVLANTITSSTGSFLMVLPYKMHVLLNVNHLVFDNEILNMDLSQDTLINIVLKPKSYLLEEVAVTASKPKYTIKEDGNMIVTVDQIPGHETDNVFDLLKKLPGVIASDNQGVSLYGMTVELQIDGRDMPYMDLMTLLKSLPAYSLEQIELISIKGAEHDGSSQAIINLKTKQQRIDGYFGTGGVGGRHYFDNSYVGIGNAFIMLKTKNMAFSTTFGYEDFKVQATGSDSTYFGNNSMNITNKGNQSDKERHLFNNSTLTWNIKSGHNLFLNLYLFDSKLDRMSTSNYINTVNNYEVQTFANRDALRSLVSSNIGYQFENLLKIYYGYVRGNGSNDENFKNTYSDNTIIPLFHNEDNTEKQHIGKIDFNNKYFDNKFDLKAGIKSTFSDQENISLYTTDIEVPYQNIFFNAQENIFAGYLSLSYKISDKISTSGGIRSEYTNYLLEEVDTKAYPKYWNYMPSFRIIFDATPWYTLISYLISETSRPKYQTLLPGKKYTDDYNYTVGNPYLKPSTYYFVACKNVFMNTISLTAGINTTLNNIHTIKIDKGNGITETTYMNVVDSRVFNLLSSIPFNLFDNKFNGNINFQWATGKFINAHNGFVIPAGRNKMESMNLTGYFNFQLTPSIGINTNIYYRVMNKNLQLDAEPYATFDFGLNMNLLKNKQLAIGINVGDIFNAMKNNYKFYYDDNILVYNRKTSSQYIGINISYRFKGGKSFDKTDPETNDTQRFTK